MSEPRFTEETALAPRPQTQLEVSQSAYALSALSDDDFAGLVSAMKKHSVRVKQVQLGQMEYGVHYGVPGMTKSQWEASNRSPSIYKPGVEEMARLMGHTLVPREPAITYGDPLNDTSPAVNVVVMVDVFDRNGARVAVGVGACSSWETKYRWREQKKLCPNCKGPYLFFQKEAKGGQFKGKSAWWCAPRGGGCSAEFAGNDERITDQPVGKIANPDVLDLLNTLVKIATKRGRADGEITAGCLSGIFTQDLEDLAENGHAIGGARPTQSYAAVDEPADLEAAAPAGMYEDPRATPAPVDGIASDAQKNAVRNLLRSKRGLETDPEIDRALEKFGVTGGLPGLTAQQAGSVIAMLNAEVDGKAPSVAREPRSAPATTPKPQAAKKRGDATSVDSNHNRETIAREIWGLDSQNGLPEWQRSTGEDGGVACFIPSDLMTATLGAPIIQPMAMVNFSVSQLSEFRKRLRLALEAAEKAHQEALR